jgi:RNA polymerase sigma factor (sigma-70 family)
MRLAKKFQNFVRWAILATNRFVMDPGSSIREGETRRRPAWESALAATRQSLLTRLKQSDDHDGWQRFFDTYAGVIRALALRSGLASAEADDALQETLLSVSREMPGFRYDPAKGSFKAWLFQIARRRIVDQFRKRERQQRDGNDAEDLLARIADPTAQTLDQLWEDEWRSNQLQLAISRVKGKTSARQWQMFDLVALQNLPSRRICDLLGVNRAQLYMARMRVGRLLKTEMQSLGSREDAFDLP